MLITPRMSTETYTHLRHVYKERLLAYFPQVQLDTLIEAPDKHDYGDIDFVLANDGQIDFFDLASHLGARGTWESGIRCISNMSFALNRDLRCPVVQYCTKPPPQFPETLSTRQQAVECWACNLVCHVHTHVRFCRPDLPQFT